MDPCDNNVTTFLLANKEPNRIALQLAAESCTYGELQSAALEVARYFVLIGAHKGDRILLVSHNSFFWAVSYLGALQAGLVCVPLAVDISPQDLNDVLQTTEARVACVQAGFARKAKGHVLGLHIVTDRKAPGLPECASQRTLSEARVEALNQTSSLPVVYPEDLAALMFTSGSTGRSRGVMVSHANIMANTESIIQYLRLTKDDRIMAVLPFHYCFGVSLLHTHLRAGGSLVIDVSFMYPEVVLERMLCTECTGFAGVPSHFQILLRRSSLRKRHFPHLRYVQQAGGHLAPLFIRKLREALPETQVFVMYGQTEATARLAYLPPESLEAKVGSIGKAIPGVTLQVLNESGDQVRAGEIGEIVAEGKNVAQGYWRAPTESANYFRNGKLYTGDLATVDDDGFLYVVDRAKDFLKCGGKRISCQQLEDQLLEFDGLLEAAVVGVPDDVLGEAVKAFVVASKGDCAGVEERLLRFCKERMAPQLVPKEIVVLESLPKNSSGKVQKQTLRGLSSFSALV